MKEGEWRKDKKKRNGGKEIERRKEQEINKQKGGKRKEQEIKKEQKR